MDNHISAYLRVVDAAETLLDDWEAAGYPKHEPAFMDAARTISQALEVLFPVFVQVAEGTTPTDESASMAMEALDTFLRKGVGTAMLVDRMLDTTNARHYEDECKRVQRLWAG